MMDITPFKNDDHEKCSTEAGDESWLKVGNWVWVAPGADEGYDEPGWFGCITHVGSNYVKVDQPKHHNGRYTVRVHFNEVFRKLKFEPNHKKVIANNVLHYQQKVDHSLSEARRISQKLGLNMTPGLPGTQDGSTGSGTGLAVLSGKSDVSGYQNELVVAKEETLPALFEAIKEDNQNLCTWLSAETLPIEAEMDASRKAIGLIDDRIFNISLYAGLIESVATCRDGQPASISEQLHILQRRLYMDEECLLDYDDGGMEFRDIEEFDKWLARPHNYQRILPFRRCIVAMRLRRKTKERNYLGTLVSALENHEKGLSDKFTYLFIRNGEQVFRLNTTLDFDEQIFPDRADFDPSEPMMFNPRSSRSEDPFMTKRDFDARKAESARLKKLSQEWREKRKAAGEESHWIDDPYSNHRDRIWPFSARESDYHPVDPSSVYFDDALEKLGERVKKYNRISLIIQGLLDRSQCLHPHVPIQMWNAEHFSRHIKLVYDNENALYSGLEAPDFEAYRQKANESIGLGSVVVGQRDAWRRSEAEKMNKKVGSIGGYSSDYRFYEPYGDPGPPKVAIIEEWKPRARKAVFRWERESKTWDEWGDRFMIRTSLTVPESKLFNISAYKKGDYLQFFRDPRTREQYLKWAPMLMTAEEYHRKGSDDLS